MFLIYPRLSSLFSGVSVFRRVYYGAECFVLYQTSVFICFYLDREQQQQSLTWNHAGTGLGGRSVLAATRSLTDNAPTHRPQITASNHGAFLHFCLKGVASCIVFAVKIKSYMSLINQIRSSLYQINVTSQWGHAVACFVSFSWLKVCDVARYY